MIDVEGVLYFEVEDALVYHAAVKECSLDEASRSLRSRDALEGALDRPQWQAYYAQADIALQAAALVHSMIENHPFGDGNKRTAHMLFTKFLSENGRHIVASPDQVQAWNLRIAKGELTAEEFADILRPLIRAVRPK